MCQDLSFWGWYDLQSTPGGRCSKVMRQRKPLRRKPTAGLEGGMLPALGGRAGACPAHGENSGWLPIRTDSKPRSLSVGRRRWHSLWRSLSRLSRFDPCHKFDPEPWQRLFLEEFLQYPPTRCTAAHSRKHVCFVQGRGDFPAATPSKDLS